MIFKEFANSQAKQKKWVGKQNLVCFLLFFLQFLIWEFKPTAVNNFFKFLICDDNKPLKLSLNKSARTILQGLANQ